MKKLIVITVIYFLTQNLFAQTRGFVKVRRTAKDHVALVIGNSNYPDMPLANPINDAADVAKTFADMGFIVDQIVDADKEKMAMAINRFKSKLASAKVAVFYFAGHGMQVDGENYLIPIGTTPATQITAEEQVPYRAINAGEVLVAMEQKNVKFSMVVLDACRNNPIKGRGRGKIKGLASINAPAGSLVMYATKAGDVAADGTEKNSPFTTAFLEHIKTPGLDINLLPSKVTQTVQQLTNGNQTPGSYVQLTQSFSFVPELTAKELEEIKKQQQGKLSELQQKMLEEQIQKQKEDAEMAEKQAEIEALEKQIANMKTNKGGTTDLDQMLAVVEKKEEQKKQLKAMKKKAATDRVAREKAMKELKQIDFNENIAKYKKIANSEFGQDMKEAAWNSMLRNFGLSSGSISVGDEMALKRRLDLLPALRDSRDGKTYEIVEIGRQVWMAENLNYESSNSYCYDDNSSNCAKDGRLYIYETAKNVCPIGWHLPSKAEFETLLDNFGGEGNGTYVALKEGGSSGFNALFSGGRNGNGNYRYMGGYGLFWSSTEYGSDCAWYMRMDSSSKEARMGRIKRRVGRSVRCVQD